MSDDTRFDGIFMNVVQQSKGIDNFFDNLFGFMRRKTDFFTNDTLATTKVNEYLKKNLAQFTEDKERQALIEAKKKQKAQEEKEEAEKRANKESTGGVEEITEEEAAAFEKEQKDKEEAAKKASEAPVSAPAEADEEATPEEEEDEEDKGKITPVNNGAKFDTYEFTQTLQDLTVSFYIPEGIKAKNLDIVITAKKMKVGIKGEEPILSGEWNKIIKTEDTLWTIEDMDGRRVVQIQVDKSDKMTWWDCVVKGEPLLNTKKIDPENSKLSDLDGETRQTVEKMMFDQQQKQKGLPTSDEQMKQNKLQEFMKAHPEMDFSKAKFT